MIKSKSAYELAKMNVLYIFGAILIVVILVKYGLFACLLATLAVACNWLAIRSWLSNRDMFLSLTEIEGEKQSDGVDLRGSLIVDWGDVQVVLRGHDDHMSITLPDALNGGAGIAHIMLNLSTAQLLSVNPIMVREHEDCFIATTGTIPSINGIYLPKGEK